MHTLNICCKKGKNGMEKRKTALLNINAVSTFAFHCILQYGNSFAFGTLYVRTLTLIPSFLRTPLLRESEDEEINAPRITLLCVCITKEKKIVMLAIF